MNFMIEVSARHIHLSQEDLDVLFGKGYVLTVKKNLSQPGQYACEERLDVVGPKSTIKGVSILGPVRASSQVEVSLTDARSLGLDAPIRESGDIIGSNGCTLVGPVGSVTLKEGVIVAKRHLHCTPEDAVALGVKDKDIINVKVATPTRSTIFCDTVVRVNPNFKLAMHIDTDESNAVGGACGIQGEIVK